MRTTEFTVPCTCCTQRAPRIARSCLKRRLSNSTRISIVQQRNSLTSKIEMEVGLAVHAMMSYGITCTSFRLTQLNASTRCSPDGDIDSQTSTKTGQAKYTDSSLPTKNTSMRITPPSDFIGCGFPLIGYIDLGSFSMYKDLRCHTNYNAMQFF